MLFISTRESLNNEDKLGSTTYWNIGIEDQVEVSRDDLSLDEFKNQISGKSILVIVHGYNNEFEDIPRAYDIIESNLEKHAGTWHDLVIGFTWPGGDSTLDWYAPKRRAGIVAPRFAKILKMLNSVASEVDVLSHSLGSRIALGGISMVDADTVRANFLMASAVDNEVIETNQKYFSAVRHGATESVVFHSKYDSVLKTAYRLAEWDNPLGLYGPENPSDLIYNLPNVFVANCRDVILGHGEYKSCEPIFQYINDWMDGNIQDQFSLI